MSSKTHENEATAESSNLDLASDLATIQQQRSALHHRLLNGATGEEIVKSFTDFVDAVLIARYRNITRRANEEDTVGLQRCCLVAVGGYGRRELAPYSDIDVMVLYQFGETEIISTLSKQLFHHLWDLGFQVGHSVRSISECLTLAEADLSTRTSIMESRFLIGNSSVFQDFQRRFSRRILGRQAGQFIQQKIEERQREYTKFGETVYLLEPNIKKSKGGLRDLHLLQWAGMAKYQAMTLQELANQGLVTHQDYLALKEAREFLWRVRCLMHVQAGRAQEILSFEEQVRIAKQFGFNDESHMLAVEQFMQLYYRHTTGIHDRCMRFIDRTGENPWWKRLFHLWPERVIEGCFCVSAGRLTIPDGKLVKVLDSPELLVRLFRLVQEQALSIDSLVLDELQQHLAGMPNELFHTPAVSQIFRQILSGPGPIADTLDAMHRARLLEKLVPAFARVRGLMQFNQYHKYTVDEHSLLAVRQAEQLEKDSGLLRMVYSEITQKDLLHLALLLHDLGKGRPEDHSEFGKVIAQRTADRLGLDQHDARTLEFLVYRHLLMANTAFRRDLQDDKVILSFAREVKSPEVLRKLLILTVADIAAVGPDMMSKWKEALLLELYSRTLAIISGERDGEGGAENLEKVTQEIVNEFSKSLPGMQGVQKDSSVEGMDMEWVNAQLQLFPSRYVSNTHPAKVFSHLSAIKQLESSDPIVQPYFNPELKVCEYTLITDEEGKRGIFMNTTGVLAAMGLQVLDAHIVTRTDGIVVDTFSVSDPDYEGEPPIRRLERVVKMIIRVLKGEESVAQVVEQGRRVNFGRRFPTGRQPTEVQIDNETSEHYSVIDVFANDQQGLLYVIACAIYDLGLSIHSARIGTRLDQVVDVFYVSDGDGLKVRDPVTGESIRQTIRQAVDTFLDQ